MSSEAIPDQLSIHQEENTKVWIFTVQGALSSEDFTKFVVAMWAIWVVRRKAIHLCIFKTSHAIYDLITSSIRKLEVFTPHRVSHRSATPHPIGWMAPPEHRGKLNVDAAVGRRGQNEAVDAIFRVHARRFMGASAFISTNIGDAATLEALAIREGLALAKDVNQNRIHVALECKGW